MERYEVLFEGKSVGTVTVDQEGLYYCIDCKSSQVGAKLVRLRAAGDMGEADLGILIPEADQLRLRTRVAVKRIGKGKLRFEIKFAKEECEEWVAVRPDEPFIYLSRLQSAYLKKKNGEAGIVFTQKDSSKPTGQ